MLLEGSSSLEDHWLAVFRELGEPHALLACTFTFHADFFAELLARFAEVSCESGASDGRSFTHLPVDVVCDRSRYHGHRVGFNVTLWPNSARLFHPKIFIALFRDEVVWSDGSLNLTPAGWHRNREIAMVHRPRRMALPGELRELLGALPGVAAAQRILEATSNERASDLPGRYLTSLRAPIGARYVSTAPKHVAEIHLVAPFFEKDESSEASLDDHWLRLLAKRYSQAQFHVYLPLIEADPLRVQGCRERFETLEEQITHRIALHPVVAAPGPLHGKIACLVHTTSRTQRAHILVGSPNMTRAALMVGTSSGNVESAWILDERWQDAKPIFRALGSRVWSIDDAEFVEPLIDQVEAWMPLRRAIYDPLQRELRVDWTDAADARKTAVRYAGRTLSLGRHGCRNFELVDGVGWLVTRKRGGGAAEGFCPIEIPVELLPACQHGAPERSPEDWLRMLGAVSADRLELGTRGTTRHGEGEVDPGAGFKWSERVRDLAARMRYLEGALRDVTVNSVEREWLLKLFLQIFDSHDPSAVASLHAQIWRVWVRIEMWHVAASLSTKSATRRDRALWRDRMRSLRRRLGLSSLTPALRSQMQTAVKALRGIS